MRLLMQVQAIALAMFTRARVAQPRAIHQHRSTTHLRVRALVAHMLAPTMGRGASGLILILASAHRPVGRKRGITSMDVTRALVISSPTRGPYYSDGMGLRK